MSARTKLNSAFVLGSVVIAALVGTLTHSWLAFVMTALLLMGMCLADGAIRPAGRKGRP